MNPFIVEEAQARLEAAVVWRLEQVVRAATPSLSTRVRSAIGNALIVWGMRMKMQVVPAEGRK